MFVIKIGNKYLRINKFKFHYVDEPRHASKFDTRGQACQLLERIDIPCAIIEFY